MAPFPFGQPGGNPTNPERVILSSYGKYICTRKFVPYFFGTKYLVQKKYHKICTILFWYKKRGTKQIDQNAV